MIYLGPTVCFLLPLIASFLATIYYRKFKAMERKTGEYFKLWLEEEYARARLEHDIKVYKSHMSPEALTNADNEISSKQASYCESLRNSVQ